MRWDEALTAAKLVDGRSKLVASALSYHYLNGGPALLSDREHKLRRVISSIPEGERLPPDLCRDLLAWADATSIAHRRSKWDLPPSWSDTGPESR